MCQRVDTPIRWGHNHIHIHIRIYIYISLSLYLRTYIYAYIHTSMCIHTCVYVCLYIYLMSGCMYGKITLQHIKQIPLCKTWSLGVRALFFEPRSPVLRHRLHPPRPQGRPPFSPGSPGTMWAGIWWNQIRMNHCNWWISVISLVNISCKVRSKLLKTTDCKSTFVRDVHETQ